MAEPTDDYGLGHAWMIEDESRAIIYIPEDWGEDTITCIGKVCWAFAAGRVSMRDEAQAELDAATVRADAAEARVAELEDDLGSANEEIADLNDLIGGPRG